MNNIKTFENFNNQNIFKYIGNDDIESVKNYIDSGYDLNKQTIIGNTALIKAVSNNNNIEIVKLLLDSGVNIDKQNNYGHTALIDAASNNNVEIVELLLYYGSDEFILDNNDKSFYDYLNTKNQQYFRHKYPTSVYNAISHNYKKSFTEFVKDYNIKIKK